jgi:hypothetical protein
MLLPSAVVTVMNAEPDSSSAVVLVATGGSVVLVASGGTDVSVTADSSVAVGSGVSVAIG